MAGLSAAHELIERGFSVTVYEPAYLGGKARSHDVPGTARGGRKALPGEHGFRFFPGCYQHTPDTMERIPLPGGGNVKDRHLVNVEAAIVAFADTGYAPTAAPASIMGAIDHAGALLTLENLRNAFMTGLRLVVDIPPHELAYFVTRELIIATSCTERRLGQWENQSWVEFVKAKGKSPAYQKYLAGALTRALVLASRRPPRRAPSARSVWRWQRRQPDWSDSTTPVWCTAVWTESSTRPPIMRGSIRGWPISARVACGS